MTTAAAPELDLAPTVSGRSWRRIALWVAGALVLVLALLALIGLRYDQARHDELLPGISVGGVAVGGDDIAAVRRRFEARIPELARRAVRVEAGPFNETVRLGQMGLRSDVDEALARARADADDMGLGRRLWHRLLDKPVERSYAVRYHVERQEVRGALAGLAERVAREPADARIDTSTGFVRIIPAVEGRSLDITPATDGTTSAATLLANDGAEAPVVEAPLLSRKPTVTGYADVILVRTGENRLYHYENGALRRSYVVATGTPRYATPKGNFQVTLKRFRPTWVNPDPTGWGRSLPRSIPPGPGNPLGTRALNINAPGIRIHGTSNVRSLGTAASHGCIRMAMSEVEELFELVETGTPVVIISGPATSAAADQPITSLGDPNAPVDLEAG